MSNQKCSLKANDHVRKEEVLLSIHDGVNVLNMYVLVNAYRGHFEAELTFQMVSDCII